MEVACGTVVSVAKTGGENKDVWVFAHGGGILTALSGCVDTAIGINPCLRV